MTTISIELLTSFSLELTLGVITCLCDVITVVILIIEFKRKNAAHSSHKTTQRLSVHRFSNKR